MTTSDEDDQRAERRRRYAIAALGPLVSHSASAFTAPAPDVIARNAATAFAYADAMLAAEAAGARGESVTEAALPFGKQKLANLPGGPAPRSTFTPPRNRR